MSDPCWSGRKSFFDEYIPVFANLNIQYMTLLEFDSILTPPSSTVRRHNKIVIYQADDRTIVGSGFNKNPEAFAIRGNFHITTWLDGDELVVTSGDEVNPNYLANYLDAI